MAFYIKTEFLEKFEVLRQYKHQGKPEPFWFRFAQQTECYAFRCLKNTKASFFSFENTKCIMNMPSLEINRKAMGLLKAYVFVML